MVIAAVAATDFPLPAPLATSYAQEAQTGFWSQRSWLNLIDAGRLRLAMGGEAYDRMRADYRVGAVASPAWLAAIKTALPEVGYALFALIEENATRAWRDENGVYEEREIDGEKRRVKIADETKAKASRRVSVSLSIYDLETGGEVWRGRVTKTAAAERTYTRNVRDASDTVGIVVDLIGGVNKSVEERYPYPSMPDERPLLRSVFAGFAENFPGDD